MLTFELLKHHSNLCIYNNNDNNNNNNNVPDHVWDFHAHCLSFDFFVIFLFGSACCWSCSMIFVILQMAGCSLESELRTWKKHTQIFVSLANKNINGTDAQQTQLHDRVESAQNSIIR